MMNFVAAIFFRRHRVADAARITSKISARNLRPRGEARDTPAPSRRHTASAPILSSISHGRGSPRCKSKFWRRRFVSVLLRAGRDRGLAVEICAAITMAPNEFSKRTCHSFGQCRGAGQATSNECDPASGNRLDKIIPRARRRATLFHGIGNEKNQSASRCRGQKWLRSSEQRHRLGKIHGLSAGDNDACRSWLELYLRLLTSSPTFWGFFGSCRGDETPYVVLYLVQIETPYVVSY
jgi:hypothetical protein